MPTNPSTVRRSRFWIKGIALLLGCGLAFGFAELTLRLIGYSYPVKTQSDAFTGYAYVPESDWEHTSEGHAQVHINSAGFRDREWTLQKPTDTIRIAIIGDSFVAAFEVEEHDRFTAIIANELKKSKAFSGKKIEVLNFGQGGIGTAQEFMILRHKVVQFQPDMVLLAVFTANDIRNNSKELEREPVVPYFRLNDTGELVLDTEYLSNAPGLAIRSLKFFARYLRSVQVFYQFWQTRKAQANLQVNLAADERLDKFHFTDPVGESVIYLPPVDENWQEAWRLTDALIRGFKAETERQHAQLFVVSLSNDIQVHPDAGLRKEFADVMGISDFYFPDRRISEICTSAGIPNLVLAPEMQKQAEVDAKFYHGFDNTRLGVGHWNANGHAVAGRMIAKWLLELQYPH